MLTYNELGKKGKLLASVPKDREIDSITLAEALQWINERAARGSTIYVLPSPAACTRRTAAASDFGTPRCQPPSARIETGMPLRPNGRVGIAVGMR